MDDHETFYHLCLKQMYVMISFYRLLLQKLIIVSNSLYDCKGMKSAIVI